MPTGILLNTTEFNPSMRTKPSQTGHASSRRTRVRARNSREPKQLAEVLRGIVAHRAREIALRGIDIRLPAAPSAAVFVDAPLLFSLLTTTLDWALVGARSAIDLRIDVKSATARLTCLFAHQADGPLVADVASPRDAPRLDAGHWRLLQQTAQAMDLPVALMVDARSAELTLEFPRTDAAAERQSALRIDESLPATLSTRLIAGSHVLVVAQHHEVRVQVAEALSSLGLIVDFGMSVEEAVDFCRDGLPHAIVVESGLCRGRFTELRHDIAAEEPRFVFVEIIEDHRHFDMSGFNHAGMAHVQGDAIVRALPSALLAELARGRSASASTSPAPLNR